MRTRITGTVLLAATALLTAFADAASAESTKLTPAIAQALKQLAWSKDGSKASKVAWDIARWNRRDKLKCKAGVIRALMTFIENEKVERGRKALILQTLVTIGGPETADFLAEKVRAANERNLDLTLKPAGAFLESFAPEEEKEVEDGKEGVEGEKAKGPDEKMERALGYLLERVSGVAEDGYGEARVAAIEVLGKARRREAAPVLLSLLKEPETKLAAGKALQRIFDKNLPADFDAWQRHVASHLTEDEADLMGGVAMGGGIGGSGGGPAGLKGPAGGKPESVIPDPPRNPPRVVKAVEEAHRRTYAPEIILAVVAAGLVAGLFVARKLLFGAAEGKEEAAKAPNAVRAAKRAGRPTM